MYAKCLEEERYTDLYKCLKFSEMLTTQTIVYETLSITTCSFYLYLIFTEVVPRDIMVHVIIIVTIVLINYIEVYGFTKCLQF